VIKGVSAGTQHPKILIGAEQVLEAPNLHLPPWWRLIRMRIYYICILSVRCRRSLSNDVNLMKRISDYLRSSWRVTSKLTHVVKRL
jgi:hypothetical protein